MSGSLFYFFAALTLVAAFLVVFCRNPVNSAMAMILALLGVAANFFLLQAPFLGVLQVLVYAGAVMVLFVVVITLLNVSRLGEQRRSWFSLVSGIVVLALVGGSLLWLVWKTGNLPAPPPRPVLSEVAAGTASTPFVANAKSYGNLLFGKYMLPTLITGFLLLSAMIGVFLLTGKHPAAAPTTKE